MPKYLLDTNIVSFLVKQSHPALEQRARRVLLSELAISSVTEGELRCGLARLPKEATLQVLITEFIRSVEVLPWDSACAQIYGRLRQQLKSSGEAMSFADTMLAAHALTLDLTFITNDQAFSRIRKLKSQDWTQGPHPA